MIVIDPGVTADVTFTRASTGTYFDLAGVMQTAAINAVRVSYTMGSPTTPPQALIEPAATNLLTYSDQFDNAAWTKTLVTVTANYAVAPDGTATADRVVFSGAAGSLSQATGLVVGTTCSGSVYVKGVLGETIAVSAGGVDQIFIFNGSWQQLKAQNKVSVNANFNVNTSNGVTARDFVVWGAQMESGKVATSYIPTTAAPVARAADVVGATAGILYCNVPETEAIYTVGGNFALAQIVRDPVTHLTYQSLVSANTGNALTDTTKWTPRGATNQRAMVDQYNNTQTTSAGPIVMVWSPQQISQGVFVGNVDADVVTITVQDAAEGVVYTEVQQLLAADSNSSLFNWLFKRMRKSTYAVSVLLPPYANAIVTITLSKASGNVKCGMMVVGSLVDVGLSKYGIGTEIKDYSTTLFAFDGTSSTTLRGFAKRMNVDVLLSNGVIDAVQERLASMRQKPVVWLGDTRYGCTCLFGTFSSFKNIIQYLNESSMSLQIEGTV